MRRSSRIRKLKAEREARNQYDDRQVRRVGGGGEVGKETTKSAPGSWKRKLDSTSGTALVRKKNPLENPVILSHLFKLCPAEVLANCRLVCKQWYQESLLTWRSDFPITFKSHMEIKNRLILENNDPLQNYLTYFSDSKNRCTTKPYRSVKIRGCQFSGNPEQHGAFWNVIGRNLTTLELSWCTFREVDEFRKIVFTACPNLQTLSLCLCEYPGAGKTPVEEPGEYTEPVHGRHTQLKSLNISSIRDVVVPVSWLELFSHFQSLTRFSVSCVRNEEFERLTDAIRAVRKQDPKALPFKCFGFQPLLNLLESNPVTQKTLSILQDLPLPLNDLSVGVNLEMGMDKNFLKNALTFLAKSITTIILIGTSAVLGQPFPFGVQLDSLTTLSMTENLCESMAFLKFMPKLKVLVISGANYVHCRTNIISNSCNAEMANVRMIHLETLVIDCIVSGEEDVAKLFDWMPNLTSLRMNLNDKEFARVCGNWKNVTKLTVTGYRLTDAGVTGRDDYGMGEDMDMKNQCNQTPPKEAEATRPNITDLQKLKEFGFWSKRVGNASVFQGFLQLPHLRQITFLHNSLQPVRITGIFGHPCWEKEASMAIFGRGIGLYQNGVPIRY